MAIRSKAYNSIHNEMTFVIFNQILRANTFKNQNVCHVSTLSKIAKKKALVSIDYRFSVGLRVHLSSPGALNCCL